ncbi:MAG: DUF362 domain-containing protein [Bryobacterales bacterium]|nr:DUF362 domain-containing protein [Bryobacterales bacterium]
MNRRDFLVTSAAAGMLPAAAMGAATGKTKLGLIASTNNSLVRPASPEDPLTYEQVRDMVWKAIEMSPPRAGSLDAKIKPGSWVVIKPNIVFLRPHPSYTIGDVTDFRVTHAVAEYVARHSRAGRITIAEGGTFRSRTDPAKDNVVTQAGQRVTAYEFDWGPKEFPGWAGSLSSMLADFRRRYPGKQFDHVDLSYDAVRDPSGKFARLPVPLAPNGVGAFGARSDYFVTNTITKCDFLITVPVMKIHLQSGITACLKNYVGTAPRQAYATPGVFHNANLHSEHSAGGRIDPFIVDLAAFHPPDYCVIDGIRGLQRQEHSIHRPDQMVRSNLVFACEDPVASDAMVAGLLGFRPWDIEFLHMAQRRGMGSMDLDQVDVRGDDPVKLTRRWEKPDNWYGRCNREWRLTTAPGQPVAAWKPYTGRFDTLDLSAWAGAAARPDATYGAAVKVVSEGHRKAYLWLGVRGKVNAQLNGDTIAAIASDTTFRIGQFQYPVELRPGVNRIQLRVSPIDGKAMLSLLLVGDRNDGDTVSGITWARA